MKQNKPYVSALDLIELSNDIGNAIVFCEHSINQLNLGNGEHDFEVLWRDLFEIHFWDCEDAQSEAAKMVLEALINSMCISHKLSLVSEDDFSNEDIDFGEQLELNF